jgi:hypothetical protein
MLPHVGADNVATGQSLSKESYQLPTNKILKSGKQEDLDFSSVMSYKKRSNLLGLYPD